MKSLNRFFFYLRNKNRLSHLCEKNAADTLSLSVAIKVRPSRQRWAANLVYWTGDMVYF